MVVCANQGIFSSGPQALVPGSLLARCSLGAASTISQDGETGLSQRPDHAWTVSVSNSEL